MLLDAVSDALQPLLLVTIILSLVDEAAPQFAFLLMVKVMVCPAAVLPIENSGLDKSEISLSVIDNAAVPAILVTLPGIYSITPGEFIAPRFTVTLTPVQLGKSSFTVSMELSSPRVTDCAAVG